MKRSKFVAGLLALSMVLMGTGYAYWTDSLKIETTASTGELEVKFVDVVTYGQYSDEEGWAIYDGTGVHEKTSHTDENGYEFKGTENRTTSTKDKDTGYNDLSNKELEKYEQKVQVYNNIETTLGRTEGIRKLNEDELGLHYDDPKILVSDVMTMNVDNMYPGYAQFFEGDIINTGTVAAKLSNIKYDVEVEGPTTEEEIKVLKEMIGVSLDIVNDLGKEIDNRTLAGAQKENQQMVFGDEEIFKVGSGKHIRTFVRLSAIERATKNESLKLPLNKFIIKAKDKHNSRLDVFSGIAMDPDREGRFTSGHVKLDPEDKIGKNTSDAHSQLGKGIKVTATLQWDQFNAPDNSHNPEDENKPTVPQK